MPLANGFCSRGLPRRHEPRPEVASSGAPAKSPVMRAPLPPFLRTSMPAAALGLAAVAVGIWWWGCLCLFSTGGWNAVRLAPSFMWRAGVNPYPGPLAGPVTTWIYGPLPILLEWPATLTHDAASALLAGGVISLALLAAPMVLAVLAQSGPTASFTTRGWACLLALAGLPAVNLVYCQADNAAVACGLLAGVLLTGPAPPTQTRLWLAAAAATLALWAKQTELGPVLGQIIYLGLRYGRRAAAAQALRAAATGGLAGLVFCRVFGAEGLVYNMFILPAGFPLLEPAAKTVHPLYLGFVLTYVVAPALLVALLAPRLFRRDHPALAPVLVFACSLPFNFAGFLPIGGNLNSLHGAVYLLPAAALWLAARRLRPGPWPWPAPAALAAVLAVQIASQWPLPLHLQQTGLREGASLARQLPGEIYFPWNPLLTFFSEGRFYHVEDGLITRSLAGRPVPPSVVKAYLPPRMCVVAYHRYAIDGYVRGLIPVDAKRTAYGEWILFSWPPPAVP